MVPSTKTEYRPLLVLHLKGTISQRKQAVSEMNGPRQTATKEIRTSAEIYRKGVLSELKEPRAKSPCACSPHEGTQGCSPLISALKDGEQRHR